MKPVVIFFSIIIGALYFLAYTGCSGTDRAEDIMYLEKLESRIDSLHTKARTLNAVAAEDTTDTAKEIRRKVVDITTGLDMLQSKVDSLRNARVELTPESKQQLEKDYDGIESTYLQSTRIMRK